MSLPFRSLRPSTAKSSSSSSCWKTGGDRAGRGGGGKRVGTQRKSCPLGRWSLEAEEVFSEGESSGCGGGRPSLKPQPTPAEDGNWKAQHGS